MQFGINYDYSLRICVSMIRIDLKWFCFFFWDRKQCYSCNIILIMFMWIKLFWVFSCFTICFCFCSFYIFFSIILLLLLLFIVSLICILMLANNITSIHTQPLAYNFYNYNFNNKFIYLAKGCQIDRRLVLIKSTLLLISYAFLLHMIQIIQAS